MSQQELPEAYAAILQPFQDAPEVYRREAKEMQAMHSALQSVETAYATSFHQVLSLEDKVTTLKKLWTHK